MKNFDLKTRRRVIINMRVQFGADTLEGHACSNLVEQMESWEIAKAEGNALQLKNLAKLMPRQMAVIAGGSDCLTDPAAL